MIDIVKAEIYQSLAAMNQATEQITESLERLRDAGLLMPHIAEIRILTTQQTCAETNTTALLALARQEQENAARIEKERIERENKLKAE